MKNIILKIATIAIILFLFACPNMKENSIILYYSDSTGMNLIPVNVSVGIGNIPDNTISPDQVDLMLKQLSIPRPNKSLIECIPEKISFTNIKINKDKKLIELTIDSPKMRLGEREELLMIGAIVNTLTELDKNYSIKFNQGNLESEMDYSEPYQREIFINDWYTNTNISEDYSLALVYWFSKNNEYFVPITVPIPKDDVQSLLNILKKGPQKNAKNYLNNSIDANIEISIKSVNSKHIDIELKSSKEIEKDVFEKTKLATLLTISELNIFDSVKFITPYGEDKIIDLTKENFKKLINKI